MKLKKIVLKQWYILVHRFEKQKQKIKICVDFLMTGLLLCLMAYQIIGQELHEWFGAGMLVLFLLHNALNAKWYGHLFKGKYTPLRIVQTIVNLGVLTTMLCLGFSGIVLSRHVFSFCLLYTSEPSPSLMRQNAPAPDNDVRR